MIALGLAVAVPCGAIALPFIVIPSYFLNIRSFLRIMIYWSRMRFKELKNFNKEFENAPPEPVSA